MKRKIASLADIPFDSDLFRGFFSNRIVPLVLKPFYEKKKLNGSILKKEL
ncbi:MAG: hypothetical protein WBN77_13825 [Desulfobacterales bacterium]